MTGVLPRIVARSLPEANDDIARLGPRTAIVSIGEPGTPTPYGFQPHNPLHVRLQMHDIVADDLFEGLTPPSRAHVQALLRAATILRTAELVYCHCNAGISRSTAVAYILRCAWTAPGEEAAAWEAVQEDRPQADPNPLLVRYGDELLDRAGAMVAAIGAAQ